MGWVITGVIVLIFVGIAALPLGFYVLYDGNPVFWLTASLFRIRVFPPKEETDPRKRIEKQKKAEKKAALKKKKAAARAAKKAEQKKKARAKAASAASTAKKRKRSKKEMRRDVNKDLHPKKLTPRLILEYAELGKDILAIAVGDICRYGRVDRLELDMKVGDRDAAAAGLLYGRACAVVYPLDGILSASKHVKNKKIRISLDFNETELKINARLHCSIRLWRLINIAFKAAFRLLKDNPFAAEPEESLELKQKDGAKPKNAGKSEKKSA